MRRLRSIPVAAKRPTTFTNRLPANVLRAPRVRFTRFWRFNRLLPFHYHQAKIFDGSKRIKKASPFLRSLPHRRRVLMSDPALCPVLPDVLKHNSITKGK
ncbi:hypothetical protein EBU02_08755 [bacterium]|nr:hypothetical protein [bacterium]NBS53657.1 hypothetical protein [Spartobacteria bacterium]